MDAPVALVLALALAGCVVPSAPGGSALLEADASRLAPVVLAWNGSFALGAGSEMPAHFPETAPLVAPLWPDNMRNVEIDGAPRAFVVRMSWTGAPGTQMQLMVEAPAVDGRVDLFTAPGAGAYSTEPTLCVPVPVDALSAGHWKVMPHSRAGADVRFSITVEVAGAPAAWTEEMEHWQTAAEFAQRMSSGAVVDHPAEACEAAR